MDTRTATAIAGLGITQIIGWGSNYYLLTVISRPVAADLGLAPEVVSVGQSILMILSGLLGPLVGRIMDIRGAKPVMVTGSLVSSLGLLVLSFASGPVTFLGAWVLMGISASMILYAAAFTALTQVDPVNARRNITILTLPGGLASTVFWPLGTWLLGWLDWREVCLVYAALNLFICLPLHFMVTPSNVAKAATGSPGLRQVAGLPEFARRRAFILFAAVLALNSLVIAGMMNQFLYFLDGIGHAPQAALAIAMLFGFSQVFGRIVEISLSGRHDALHIGLTSCGFLVLALLLLPFSPQIAGGGYVFAILLGISNGLMTIMQGALVLLLFGSRGYGESIGTVAVAKGFTSALSPILFAALLTRLGAGSAATFCICVSIAALGAMALLYRHARTHLPKSLEPSLP